MHLEATLEVRRICDLWLSKDKSILLAFPYFKHVHAAVFWLFIFYVIAIISVINYFQYVDLVTDINTNQLYIDTFHLVHGI